MSCYKHLTIFSKTMDDEGETLLTTKIKKVGRNTCKKFVYVL